jgi:trimeric autotransporter adhesin
MSATYKIACNRAMKSCALTYERVSEIRKKTSVQWLAVTALMAAPLGDVSAASLYVNEGDGGQCSQMLGAGLLGVQIPISIVANKACGVTSLTDLSNAGASKGTLSLNANGAFLLGDLHIGGALDLNGNALHNLADGGLVTDAVNLRQLRANAQSVANALGGFTIIGSNGTVTQPLYIVQGVVANDVGSALRLLDGGIDSSNDHLASLTERVSSDEGNVMSLLEGKLGIVRQTEAGTITVGAESGGTLLNVAGNVGDRRITGVADGVDGHDAATMNQLQHVQVQIADVNALSVQYDDADKHALTLGGLTAGTTVTLHNVADAYLSDDSKDAVNGSQLFATNNQVSKNTDNINALDNRVTINEADIGGLLGGTLGLVRQADTSSPVTVAVGSGGRIITVSGMDGDRVIAGVADGTQANEAVNVRQLKALQDLVGSSSALAVSYDDIGRSAITLGGAGATTPVTLHNVGDGQAAFDAVNVGQFTNLQNALQSQIGDMGSQVNLLGNRVGVLEQSATGTGTGTSVALPYLDGQAGGQGNAATAGDTPGVALGYDSVATGYNASAMGQSAQALGDHGTAIGANAFAAGPGDTALGGNAMVHADNSVAVGSAASVAGNATNAVAVGADSVVNAASGTAIGQGAAVASLASNAVAIGAGSQATQANTVSVGSTGNERTISNVAAGVNATDAVNVSQLQSVQSWAQNYTDSQVSALSGRITNVGRRADAGTASAIAMANIPQAYAPDQGSIGAGVGSYRGQAAIAVGMSTITPGGRWVLKANLSSSTQGNAGVGLGAAMVW